MLSDFTRNPAEDPIRLIGKLPRVSEHDRRFTLIGCQAQHSPANPPSGSSRARRIWQYRRLSDSNPILPLWWWGGARLWTGRRWTLIKQNIAFVRVLLFWKSTFSSRKKTSDSADCFKLFTCVDTSYLNTDNKETLAWRHACEESACLFLLS